MDESSLVMLQHKNLLLGEGSYEVSSIWKELADRLPLVEQEHHASSSSDMSNLFQPTQPKTDTAVTDVCISYSLSNGAELAK